MKKKSHYTDGRPDDLDTKQSILDGVAENLVKSDRTEWLKQLYAEWLKKRNSILDLNENTYLFNEPYELDTEYNW